MKYIKFIDYDSIIFDMDGVLIDVRKSYRVAIEKTVNYFFKKNKIKINQKNIEIIKSLEGFNNDWDVSYAIIDLLKKGVRKEELKYNVKPISSLIKEKTEYKKIKDVFQMFYLGDRLFKTTENKKPSFKSKGLIFKEKLLISRDILQIFNRKIKLGIVTGRPRKEAIFTIKYFNLEEYFSEKFIFAKEDYNKEKPNPDGLLKATGIMNCKKPIYIGDSINDVITSKKANILSVFVGENNLGDIQIKNINQLKEVIRI